MDYSKEISVLIPVLNNAKYLKRCLKSITNSTNKNIEIICLINNQEIKTRLDGIFSEVTFVIGNFMTEGEALNYALKECKGKYISVVRPNDFIGKKMYKILLENSNNYTIDVVAANYYDVFCRSSKLDRVEKGRKGICIPYSFQPFVLHDRPEILKYEANSLALIIKRDFLTENNIAFKEDRLMVYSLWFDVLTVAKSICWCKESLYYIFKDISPEKKFEEVDPNVAFEKIEEILDVIEKNENFSKQIVQNMYEIVLSAMEYLQRDLRYEPYDKTIKKLSYKITSKLNKNIIGNLSDHLKELYYILSSPMLKKKLEGPNILIYNWLPFDNPWGWGGGVTVYCKNILEEIIKKRPDVNVYFLSSGFAYSSDTLKTYIRKIENIFGDSVQQYEVVNSPVPADQREIYVNPSIALKKPVLKEIIKNFIIQHGPFEAIHFNNIEGISLDVLDLKKDFKDTKFVFSIHNYVPICVNGSYYMRHKHCNCNPNHSGEDCFKCTRVEIYKDLANKTYDRGKFGLSKEVLIPRKKWIKNFNFEDLDKDVTPEHILDFAKTATEKINNNFDEILAVSQRVFDIVAENGFDKNKMRVSYIGTKVAEHQTGKSNADYSNRLKVIFLGNSISYEEKGYPFLLDTFSKLEEEYAKKIDLVLTVREVAHDEIYEKCKKFHSVKVINGYSHADLECMLRGMNLSLVPVLWEDNLPQIAIESVAHGVPVLASSSGGAKELCSDKMFCFQSGDAIDFLGKVKRFVNNPGLLDKYWESHIGLVTMEEHINSLISIYGLSDYKNDNLFKNIDDFREQYLEYSCFVDLFESNSVHGGWRNRAEKLARELADVKKERDYLSYSINEIRKSKTYKIGETITAIPRKIRKR